MSAKASVFERRGKGKRRIKSNAPATHEVDDHTLSTSMDSPIGRYRSGGNDHSSVLRR
jgi:hypothetical protein